MMHSDPYYSNDVPFSDDYYSPDDGLSGGDSSPRSFVYRALENEHANYTDVRLVRDRKSGRLNAFVDFISVNDSRQFMKDCRGELEVRKSLIRMYYSTPKGHKDDDRIREALDENQINYVDVRVIKDKNTGLTKGFGFVDFATIHDAKRWMDFQKGVLHVRRHELRLSYSTPRPQDFEHFYQNPHFANRSGPLSDVSTGDWICSRCSGHNFRRRDQCYRCQLPRSQVQPLTKSVDGADLVGQTPCNTLILRCLDAMTTEDEICKVFEDTADVKIRQCHVMRDEITHDSRCFAFAELPTVADAYKVMDIVTHKIDLFEIGGKAVTVAYAKNTFNTIMATLKTEGSYNAQLNSSRNLAIDLAHAAMAAQNNNVQPDAIAMNAVAASALLSQGQTSGAAVAHAAIQQKQTEQHVISVITKSLRSSQEHTHTASYPMTVAALTAAGQALPPPSFPFHAATAALTIFPFPDTSKYIYDESTRFYYDPVTGLLYEPNSKYFYDRVSQRYYFWDQTRSTYFPVPQPSADETKTETGHNDGTGNSTQNSAESGERVRLSKGKSAQQIAKEMEKWAKRMNAQKKNQTTPAPRSDSATAEASKTADTGYAMLEAVTSNAVITPENRQRSDANLVASYGGGDDSDDSGNADPLGSRRGEPNGSTEAEGKVAQEEANLLDWAKLACLLCSRGFKDAETLQKHRTFSQLHIDNVNKLRVKYGLASLSVPTSSTTESAPGSTAAMSIASLMQLGAEVANDHARNVATRQGNPRTQYRDRAKERRERYGPPPPPRSRYTEVGRFPQPETMEPPIPTGHPTYPPPSIPAPQESAANVGNRLMEKMGWQAGQGLGRANQGRTQIIEPEFREAGVGLGIKTSKRGPASDNYKDNVKRAMYARFHELE